MSEKVQEETKDGKIIERSVSQEMKTAYMDYAMSVIVSRALPDAKDGLKPVHRRIIYNMYENGLASNKPYRKSASTVGDVLGKYHPHGDASVYDAMVRLAQEFSMRYIQVDGHGNFGSIDGDPPAAYRYTETRLTKLSEAMLEDIDQDTVDFSPNFDGRLKEPNVLPTRIPTLLINGSSGIAVGMATNMAPHNITEIINGMVAYLDNRDIDTKGLLKHISGPDFPTGGLILGKKGIEETYETGRGKLKLRGEAVIEQLSNSRQRIIIKSLPYQVNKARLIENIANLIKDKKIDGISDIRDESDKDAMVRIVIELKRDANPKVVVNTLYKHTQLETTFGIINLALVNNQPRILTLKELIEVFIEHRKEVIIRRTQFNLQKSEDRLHILEGLKIAIDNIDEVIQIIRSSYDDAKERLMARFGLSEIQAQAILDMRLRTLQGLQREKIEEEYNELLKFIAECKAILASEERQYNIVKEELLEMQKKFGDERKTKIVLDPGEIDIEDLIDEEEVIITLTHFGYIKRLPIDTYKSQRRGGRGITGISTREEDFVKEIFTASTHDTILFFTNLGKLYQLKGYEIPEASRTARGTAIVNLITLDAGEKVTAVMAIQNFADDAYLLMGTEQGMVKKTKLTEYDTNRTKGLIAINLKEDDKLMSVRLTDGQSFIMLITKKGQSIAFDEKEVRMTGRASQGVIGIRLDKGDKLVGMESVPIPEGLSLLTITENGFGKRTDLIEYRAQKRSGRGVLTYKVTSKTGDLVGARITDGTEDVMLISSKGTIIRLHVKDINVLGRATQGVTLIRTNDGSKVVSIETIKDEEDEE